MDYQYYQDEILSSQFANLQDAVSKVFTKYGFTEAENNSEEIREYLDWELLSRCEHLAITSAGIDKLLTPVFEKYGLELEDESPSDFTPGKFGVYRGYSGGGVHSGLQGSQFHKLTEVLEKAGFSEAGAFLQEIQDEFESTFWAILKGWDALNDELAGEELPIWEKNTL